jgi:hypothetical protein
MDNLDSNRRRSSRCTNRKEIGMRYLLLLADEPAAVDALPQDERMQIVRAHLGLIDELQDEGRLITSAALDPARATVVSPPGNPIVTDGPFAETKEVLGSFYVVEAGSDDEARQIAARMPVSPGLTVLIVPAVEV